MTESPRKVGRGATLLLMAGALVLAGVMRPIVETAREHVAAGTDAVASPAASLAEFDSAAIALLLGGLRGPLVMALWTSAGSDQMSEDAVAADGLDTKIELIRLLQPRFDSVHLQQIYTKAYNLSADLVSPALRYAAILDGLDYGRRVLADRPYNIDLETQLSQIYGNKLGGADERDYYGLRVRTETQAALPRARVTFPADAEEAFREAAFRAGLNRAELDVRPGGDPTQRTAVLDAGVAERMLADLPGDLETSVEPLPPAVVDASATGGRVRRLEPLLDADGNLLASATDPTRQPPADAEPGTYLDGSRVQFLDEFAPFPEGLSPQALAYEHAMRAYVLQEYAGQRHIQHSESFVQANPGRALRDWAIAAFEEGRQLEAEAMGREPPRRSIDTQLLARTELLSADLPLDGSVPYPALLRRALAMYERSRQIAEPAATWLDDHIEQYPEFLGLFRSTIDRLDLTRKLVDADLLYGRLALGEVADRDAAIAEAIAGYEAAETAAVDFVIDYHVDPRVLPAGVPRHEVSELPQATKRDLYAQMRVLRDQNRSTGRFDAERILDEFDGIRGRIAERLGRLRAAS